MRPGWRWVVAGAAVLLAVLVWSAWDKQRTAHLPDLPSSDAGRMTAPAAGNPAPAAPKPDEVSKPAPPSRERPERGRTDRP
jgi:hypothetical protein